MADLPQSQYLIPLAILMAFAAIGFVIFFITRRTQTPAPAPDPDIQKTFDPSKSEVLIEVTKNLREGILIVGPDMTVISYNDLAKEIVPRLNGSPERRRL